MSRIIYCHDVRSVHSTAELRDFPEFERCSARALGCSSPGDVVILSPHTLMDYQWVRVHYGEIGLPIASEVFFGDPKDIRRYPDYDLSEYHFGEVEQAQRPNLRRLQVTQALSSRNFFIELCRERGLPTPRTVCVNDPATLVNLLDQFGDAPSVYVKKAISAPGFGVWRCKTIQELAGVVDSLLVPFQIQEALPEGTDFLDVQYEVGPRGELLPGAISLQVLNGNSRTGNVFPAPYSAGKIYAKTDALAIWAVRSGIQGVFSFDVAVTPDGAVLLLKCKPRWSAASYSVRIADRLGMREWRAEKVSFEPFSLDGFKLPKSLAFDHSRREGIVIVNWGYASVREQGTRKAMLELLVAGDFSTQAEVLREFRRQFS